MTLILTELSAFGIVMVADSAVTFTERLPSGDELPRVLNGARKLQVVPYLNAGISVWGRGSIATSTGFLSSDVWLGDFIARHSDLHTLDEFANSLAKELRGAVGDEQKPLGFHLAGFVEHEGQKLPTFYGVRNVDGTYKHYDFHGFITGQDFPPKALSDGEYSIFRNGDYGPYAALADTVAQVLPQIEAIMGLTIPHRSLYGRMSYHMAWVRFVSELYESSGLLRTIGGSISGLGIAPEGQITYLPG